MEALLSIIENGFSDHKRDLPQQIKQYFPFHEHLSVVDGVLLYKDRILIPASLRQEILDALHSAHQVVTAMTARTESSIFWPGITSQITLLCVDKFQDWSTSQNLIKHQNFCEGEFLSQAENSRTISFILKSNIVEILHSDQEVTY